MKNKGVLTIAIVSLLIFITIASYLWYLYFHEYEGKVIDSDPSLKFLRGVELVNTGKIDYVNANVLDDESIIPTYYFSVKSHIDEDYNYVIVLENATASDGCSEETQFKRDELEYVLSLDNEVLKMGGLDTLEDNVLDINIIKGNATNDYSLKIKLKDSIVDYEDKHFHYVINMREK